MAKVQGEHSHTECPMCGSISDRTIYPFLDIVAEPELYDRMMIGDLFEYKCPACHQTKLLPHSCVYKDSEQDFYIYFVDQEVAEQIAESSARMAADPAKAENMPQMRWADTPGAFAEKAMLMTSEYDDRVIEIMKLLFEREAQENATVNYVGSCIVDLPADGFRIVLFTDNGNYYNTVIAEQVYDDIEKQILDTPYYSGKGLLLIDRDWAIMAVDGEGDEPNLNGEMVPVSSIILEEPEPEPQAELETQAELAQEPADAGTGDAAPEQTAEEEAAIPSADGALSDAPTPAEAESAAEKPGKPEPPAGRAPSAGKGESQAPRRPAERRSIAEAKVARESATQKTPESEELSETIPVRQAPAPHVGKRERAERQSAGQVQPAASPSGIQSADAVFAMDSNPFTAPPAEEKEEKKMVKDSFGFEHEAVEEESPEEFVRRMQSAEDEDEERMMMEMMGMSEEDE